MSSRKTIGITGAGGALGRALTKKFRKDGYKIVGFTHNKKNHQLNKESPNKWVYWECGKEISLKKHLKNLDILILNHGIYESSNENSSYENAIEINALSKFKILNLFEEITLNNKNEFPIKEIWINTSEAELLPALSSSYEVSKLLIGQLVTFKKNFLSKKESQKFIIRKLIIGPFKSELNPIGIMNPDLVARIIFFISKFNIHLIIVSLNPISYIIFPIKELYYSIYCKFLKAFKTKP